MLQKVKYLDLQGEKNAFVLKIKNSSKKNVSKNCVLCFKDLNPKILKIIKKILKLKKKTPVCVKQLKVKK